MKILLIENEPSLLMAMRHYLEGEPYNVSTANNFRTASVKAHDYEAGTRSDAPVNVGYRKPVVCHHQSTIVSGV